MAKRKRLTGPNPDYLPPAAPAAGGGLANAPVGKIPDPAPRRRAPIADVAQDASAFSALDEMSRTWARARAEGRMVLDLPLTAIRLDYLVRDRLAVEDDTFRELKDSLARRGQQTPVEVAELEPGRFGLISGWRRCRALQALHAETGDARYETVKALLRNPAESADAYVSMVEENEIRVDLSFFERARIVARSVDQGVFETRSEALKTLFGSASRSKRSKVGSFLKLVDTLDGVLRFPEAISERLGLRLVQALEADPAAKQALCAALEKAGANNAQAEQAMLASWLDRGAKPALKAESETVKGQGREDRAEPLPGLTISRRADGSLRLSGPAVDEALFRRLVTWLEQQRS